MSFNPQATNDARKSTLLTPKLFLEQIVKIDNDFPLDLWTDRPSGQLAEFRAKVIHKVALKGFQSQEVFLEALKLYSPEFSEIVANPEAPDVALRNPMLVGNEELWEASTLQVWKERGRSAKYPLSNAKPHDHMKAMIELAKQVFMTDAQLNSPIDPPNLGGMNPEIERLRAQREKLEKMNEESRKQLHETEEEHKRAVEQLAKDHVAHEKRLKEDLQKLEKNCAQTAEFFDDALQGLRATLDSTRQDNSLYIANKTAEYEKNLKSRDDAYTKCFSLLETNRESERAATEALRKMLNDQIADLNKTSKEHREKINKLEVQIQQQQGTINWQSGEIRRLGSVVDDMDDCFFKFGPIKI